MNLFLSLPCHRLLSFNLPSITFSTLCALCWKIVVLCNWLHAFLSLFTTYTRILVTIRQLFVELVIKRDSKDIVYLASLSVGDRDGPANSMSNGRVASKDSTSR